MHMIMDFLLPFGMLDMRIFELIALNIQIKSTTELSQRFAAQSSLLLILHKEILEHVAEFTMRPALHLVLAFQ